MADTTGSVLDNLKSQYFVDQALITLYNETPLYDFAKKTPLPKGRGDTVYWNAWNRLAGASSTLTEGSYNTAVALSSRRVSATIAQYSRTVTLTDLAEYESILDPKDGANKQLRESAKETMEWILHTGIFKSAYYGSQSKTVLLSALMSSLPSAMCSKFGTNNNSNKLFQFQAVFGISGRLSAASATAPTISAKMSLYAVRKATLALQKKNVMPMADGKFVGYAHPNALYIMKKDPSWLDWNQYQNSKSTMYTNEVGDIWGVRWIMSNLCPRYAVTAHSVNVSFIFGQEAFGCTEAMGGIQFYVVTGADKSDPVDTVTKVSYKITAAAAALNPSAGVILFTEELL